MTDIRLKWPFRMLMAGSSGAGKTTLLVKLVRSAGTAMTRSPDRVDLFFSHTQNAYEELKKRCPCPVVMHRGGTRGRLRASGGYAGRGG